MNWMAWTAPTAAFFIVIATALIVLTVWELKSPTQLRRGFLPMPTTRGDRFFISLLCAGFIHVFWLALSDWPVWGASVLALLAAIAVWRWG